MWVVTVWPTFLYCFSAYNYSAYLKLYELLIQLWQSVVCGIFVVLLTPLNQRFDDFISYFVRVMKRRDKKIPVEISYKRKKK